ncbi:hypothetical protein [Kitasatospora sp. NPDC059599]|uniref:hypothetical protein n=1 Tax=Kitasatospora sp. NPDC059599 TaxID=3346880 RepID=UPI0036879A85
MTEGGHDQDQNPATDAEPLPSDDAERVDAAVRSEREAPTVTSAEFLRLGVPELDRPPLPEDERIAGIAARMYRPRSGTVRTKQLTCSVEPAERDVIDLAAARLERSRSAFLADSGMSVALEVVRTGHPDGFVPLPDREAVTRLTAVLGTHQREIGRVGGNLNQITRQGYSTPVTDRVLEVLDELHALAAASRLAVERVLPGGRRGA